jgi:hydroxyacylglutathione hydrolase
MKSYSLSLEEFEALTKQLHTIIDLRDPDLFATAFIPGSINLMLNDKFVERAGHFFQKDQAIIIVADDNKEEQSIEQLKKLKYTNIKGYLQNGISTWLLKEKPIDLVIAIDAEELALEIKYGDLVYFDIRSKEDFKASHIKTSTNHTVEELVADTDLIDDMKTTCIYSDDGCFSMALISYLKTHKKHNFYHITGGFNGIMRNPDIEFASAKSRII